MSIKTIHQLLLMGNHEQQLYMQRYMLIKAGIAKEVEVETTCTGAVDFIKNSTQPVTLLCDCRDNETCTIALNKLQNISGGELNARVMLLLNEGEITEHTERSLRSHQLTKGIMRSPICLPELMEQLTSLN